MNDPALGPVGGEAIAGVEREISTSNEAPTTVPPAASISRMQALAVPPVARTWGSMMHAAYSYDRRPFGILILLALLPLMRLEVTAMASDQIDDRTARRDAAARAVFAASPRRDAIEFVDQWKDDWNVASVRIIEADLGEAFPQILADLGDFQTLMVSSKSLERPENLAAVCKLEALESLVIDGDGVTDDLIPKLLPLVNLKHLELWHGQLTGRTLGRLAALPKLELLSLNDTPNWSPEAAAQVVKIRSLRQFLACRLPLTDADVGVLVQNDNWERLDLDPCSITDKSLGLIARLPRLKSFETGGPSITSAGIEALSASTSLESLDLRFCPMLDDAACDALAKMPALRSVLLNEDNKITAAAARRLAQARPEVFVQHDAVVKLEVRVLRGPEALEE